MRLSKLGRPCHYCNQHGFKSANQRLSREVTHPPMTVIGNSGDVGHLLDGAGNGEAKRGGTIGEDINHGGFGQARLRIKKDHCFPRKQQLLQKG